MDDYVIKALGKLLTAKATPYWAAFSVLLFGSILAFSAVKSPIFAALTISLLTIIAVTYVGFVGYAINKDTLRLSDIASVSHYPYDTVSSELTWYIEDIEGQHARLEKRKVLAALEPMSTIKEYSWGDSKPPVPEDISIENHKVGRLFMQGSRHVTEIVLDRLYNTGDEFELLYTRKIKGGFTQDSEWVESTISTNTVRLILKVVFPKDRCFITAKALHRHGDFNFTIALGLENFSVVETKDGCKALIWIIQKPVQRDGYAIEWEW